MHFLTCVYNYNVCSYIEGPRLPYHPYLLKPRYSLVVPTWELQLNNHWIFSIFVQTKIVFPQIFIMKLISTNKWPIVKYVGDSMLAYPWYQSCCKSCNSIGIHIMLTFPFVLISQTPQASLESILHVCVLWWKDSILRNDL